MIGFSDAELDEIYNVPKKPEEFVEEIKSLADKVYAQAKVIQEQEAAILMLKEYVIQNGLKPFWEKSPKVAVALETMSKDQIVVHNMGIGQKYKRATNPDAKPMPTIEEMEEMYKPTREETQFVENINELRDAESNRPAVQLCEEEDCCHGFGMTDDD